MRSYPIHGQRRISADTRQGRPLCACAQVGAGSKLFAWVGCTDCHGTGGAGASPALHRPSRVCNSSSLTEGM